MHDDNRRLTEVELSVRKAGIDSFFETYEGNTAMAELKSILLASCEQKHDASASEVSGEGGD